MLETLLEIILWVIISGILIVLLVEENGHSRFTGRIRTPQDWQVVFSCLLIAIGCWIIIVSISHDATLNLSVSVHGSKELISIIGGKLFLGLILVILGIVLDFFCAIFRFSINKKGGKK